MTPPIHFILISLLMLMLPLLANLVEHSASSILTIFVLMGFGAWFTRRHRVGLDTFEKSVMISFAAYSLVCLAFFLFRGFFHPAFPLDWNLDHEIRMLAFLPIYYLFLRYGFKPDTFWLGIALGAIINGIYACMYIYIWDIGERATGAYHQIAFGDISIVLGFMSLAGFWYFQKKNKWLVFIPLLAVAAGVMAAFLSATRGAIIAIPALTIVFLFQLGHTPHRRMFRTVTIGILAVLTIVGYYIPGSSMENRIRSGIEEAVAIFQGKTDTPVETAVRVLMWPQAIEIIKTHPLAGVGKEGFQKHVRKNAQTREELKYITEFKTPHNMYLTQMTTYGVLGLVTLIGLFLTPLIIFIHYIRENQNVRDFAYAGVMLVIAFMHFAITESIFTRNINIAVYVILTAAVMSLCQLYPDDEKGTAG